MSGKPPVSLNVNSLRDRAELRGNIPLNNNNSFFVGPSISSRGNPGVTAGFNLNDKNSISFNETRDRYNNKQRSIEVDHNFNKNTSVFAEASVNNLGSRGFNVGLRYRF